MTDRMQISATEAGLVRVFAIDLPPDRIADLTDPDAPDAGAIAAALGADALSPDHIDLLRLSDLGEMGLDGYLIDGLGVAEDEIAADRARLRALKGYALVLPSAAFMGRAQSLTVRAPLRWVGTYAEPRSATDFTPLRSQTEPEPEAEPARKAPPSDAAMSGRVATIVLLVLFLLVVVMVWIAG